jgi:hypothetical protein
LILSADDPLLPTLQALPPEDWRRTWTTDMTIILRMDSKGSKKVVDKMTVPTEVCLRESFTDDCRDDHNDTTAKKLQVVMRQLGLLTVGCRITTLELLTTLIPSSDPSL